MSNTHIKFHDISNQKSYFSKIRKSLDMMIKVTDCPESGLAGSLRFDKNLKDELLSIQNMLTALEYKYRYQLEVNNLTSELAIDIHESGYPIAPCVREFTLDSQENFKNYVQLDDIDKLTNDLAVIAMQERRISQTLQSKIAFSRYAETGLNKDCFRLTHSAKVTMKTESKLELYISVFDTSLNMPIVYVIDYENTHSNHEDLTLSDNDDLVNDFMSRVSSNLKLITLSKAIDDKFSWFQPIKMTRIFIGPHYLNAVTEQSSYINNLFSYIDETSSIACLTVEQLKVKNVESVSGLFSKTKNTEYDLNRNRPDLCDAGVTSSSQKVIMPYSAYQVLTEETDHPLDSYQKYVIDQDGEVFVF
jgi:hypothetical protein